MRAIALIVILCACGGGGGASGDDDTTTDGGGGSGGDSGGTLTLRDRQRQLAMDLRGSPDFMIGLGNDNQGPYDNAIPIDLHYAYLVGYGDETGWPTWNTDGNYPLYFAQTATTHGVTPMFTYYQLALELENGNDAVLADTTRMHQYLADVRLLFQRIADNGTPAAVNIEPDFFGYLMQRAEMGTGPDAIVARTHHADAPECASLPETAAGLARCIVAIGRAVAPKARIGFHASMWGAWYDVLDPDADIEAAGREVGEFLNSVGAAQTDFVSVETLDRDAGFWETSGGGATCSLTNGSRGAVYWDESNASLPNFDQHLRWVKALTAELQRPALEWQTPLGVPSATCGGSDEHWRDNRVHYFFGHVPELIDAGIAGMTFGTGAGGQTNLATDGGQFKAAATAYKAAPVAM
ncbi:MAG TPA: hypothetical protein VFS15_06095 [Kofleriaceae bacterium]|nr:hypothetical protein [Kofleriaceae bacterium]